MEGDRNIIINIRKQIIFQSTPSVWRETGDYLEPHQRTAISIHSLRMEGDGSSRHTVPSPQISIHSLRMEGDLTTTFIRFCGKISIHSLRMEGDLTLQSAGFSKEISIHSLRMEGDSKTAQESVFHFAYPCTILQKRMQKTTFCTRKNGFFRKKGEKFGAKPSASFCAPMIRTDIFPQTSLTESAALPCLWFPLHRYVPPSTDNDFPGNKTAGCPFLYQSPVPADA